MCRLCDKGLTTPWSGCLINGGGGPLAQTVTPVTQTVTEPKTVTLSRGGRGKRVHATNAERQRAYRRRK